MAGNGKDPCLGDEICGHDGEGDERSGDGLDAGAGVLSTATRTLEES